MNNGAEELRKEKRCMSCYFYQDVENENIFSVSVDGTSEA
jgi:hypothetical protein